LNAIGFPSDIKSCMKDCILALIWPKKDLFAFFQDHGCTSSDLDAIRNHVELTRRSMVEAIFTKLSDRADGGLGQLRAMLKALIEWDYFNPYFFETLRKLDRQTADRHLGHLRQLVEIRDAKIKSERQRRDAAATAAKPVSRQALLDQFLDLFQERLRPQERGLAFEKLLLQMADLEDLEVTSSFRCTGEQIDGGLKFDGENYLIEAKWHDKSASTAPLYTFAGKVEGKMYGRGVFVSVNGFMPEPMRSLKTGKALKTVLVDGEDLVLVLEGQISFRSMLDEKVRAAQLQGEIYVNPITKKPKYSA